MYNIELRKKYVASVSGGKDSLYMLYHILKNPQKYPLDYVVNFDLFNDMPTAKKVVEKIQEICKTLRIPFISITPRKTFQELYERYGYPSRVARWCNSKYKLDCQKQLEEMLKLFGEKPIMYIGFCADEPKRFIYEIGNITENNRQIYPLAEDGINESNILEWAKNEPIFNDYYKYSKRMGCFMCPMSSRMNLAYCLYYYPQEFNEYAKMIKDTEKRYDSMIFGKKFEDIEELIKIKWIPRLLKEKESIKNE